MMPSEQLMPSEIAIIGMGYLGKPLAIALYQQGINVIALKKTLTSDDINLPIELITADLNQAHAFQTASQTWTHHATWVCLLPPSASPDYPQLIKQIADSAEQHHIQHLIYTSTTGVYSPSLLPINEHTNPSPITASAQKALSAEHILLNSNIEHISILRLGGLYCAERHPLYSIVAKQKIINGNDHANMIHKDRAVNAIIRAIATPNGKRIRNIVEPSRSKRDFYSQEAQKLGVEPPLFSDGISSNKRIETSYPEFSDIVRT